MLGAAPTTDPTWARIKAGAVQAAKNTGVQVSYQALDLLSTPAMSQAITTAIGSHPDGLILPLTNCAEATADLQAAFLVNTTVFAINTGSACAATLGLPAYIGQVDYQAGLAAGRELITGGAKNVLCIVPDATNQLDNDRCHGVSDALTKVHDHVQVVTVSPGDVSAGTQKMVALLNGDPTIDGLITADTNAATMAIPAVQQLVRVSSFYLASFDLSTPVLQAIARGTMRFAVDQQPYLQGYLAVTLLALYKKSLDTIVNPVISTGPTFVTSANVTQIEQLVAAGTH
ncbi:MAG: substrate-binding domain-containing protein [Ktedonobacterales bacterium]